MYIHDPLIRAVSSKFCCRLAPRGTIAWIVGQDANVFLNSVSTRAQAAVAAISVRELPNVGIEDEERDRLILIDVVSVRKPMDDKRKALLARKFERAAIELAFVSAFPSRSELAQLAIPPWGSCAWFADEPDHIIEFDGGRFRRP